MDRNSGSRLTVQFSAMLVRTESFIQISHSRYKLHLDWLKRVRIRDDNVLHPMISMPLSMPHVDPNARLRSNLLRMASRTGRVSYNAMQRRNNLAHRSRESSNEVEWALVDHCERLYQ
jgi:hypothetical protein